MHLMVAAVGALKETAYRIAQQEYSRRLSAYARLSLIEVADDPVPTGDKERERVKERQGERLAKRIPAGCYRVALTPGGVSRSSEELAAWLREEIDYGQGEIAFLIGGTLGLPHKLIAACEGTLSLSRLTFPHQLARVILLEQLYRCYRILSHAPYHY